MPLVNQILSRKPALLESSTKFTMVSTIDTISDPAYGPTALALTAGNNHHPGLYLEGSLQQRPTIVMSRGFSYLCQSDIRNFTRFTTNFNYTTGFGITAGTFSPFQYARFNNALWICGTYLDGGNFPFVAAVPYGGTFNDVASWTNRTADVAGVYARSTVQIMAQSSTHIYLILQEAATTFTLRVMRCALAGSPANTFTSVSGDISIGGSFPQAYGIRPDGVTQILVTGVDVRRSTNSGASFTTVPDTSGYIGGYDIFYSSAYSRWFGSGGGGPCYSDGDGASGTWQPCVVNGGQASPYDFFGAVEQLDAEGRYLIAVTGNDFYRSILQTYVSEDGGKSWFHNQNMLPPYYDTSTTNPSGQAFTVKTDGQVLLYMGVSGNVWNYDNALFSTSIMNL
jgi:hypothetical protein